MIKYYVCDTETTGLSASQHEVVEISIIRCDDRLQLTEFIKCEYPENASYDALRITGKTLEDLKRGKSKKEVVDRVNEFLSQDGLTPSHRCIIGHNINFDRKFIHTLFEKVNKEFPAHLWLDTIAMTKEFLKKSDISTLNITKTATGKTATTLHACCDMLNIKKLSTAHNSKVDSRNTYLLWRALMDDKKIDHLPHIKTFPHKLVTSPSVDELELLDFAD